MKKLEARSQQLEAALQTLRPANLKMLKILRRAPGNRAPSPAPVLTRLVPEQSCDTALQRRSPANPRDRTGQRNPAQSPCQTHMCSNSTSSRSGGRSSRTYGCLPSMSTAADPRKGALSSHQDPDLPDPDREDRATTSCSKAATESNPRARTPPPASSS